MESFYCNACKYKTFRKFDFHKHTQTKKHKSRTESLLSETIEEKKSESRNFQKKVVKKSTNRAQMSTNSEKMSTNRAQMSTNEHKLAFLSEKVSTNRAQMSTNEHKMSTNENSKNYNINSNEINNYSNQNYYNNNEIFNNNSESNDNFECDYCFEMFKSKAILQRHIKKYCKVKATKDEEERLMIESLRKDKEKMLEQHEKEKEEYRKQIEKLIDKVGTTNITNTNCGNTQTNNVQLNKFGQEDLTMLTDKYMNKMVAYPYSAIPKMIKKIHFNDKYPANRNIRMLNKKDNKLQIRNNGEWEYVNKKETLQLLIEDKNYQLDKYYEDNKEKFDSTKQDRFENFQDKVTIQDKKVNEGIKMDTELVFWNSM